MYPVTIKNKMAGNCDVFSPEMDIFVVISFGNNNGIPWKSSINAILDGTIPPGIGNYFAMDRNIYPRLKKKEKK
jgi:hypothetical protein